MSFIKLYIPMYTTQLIIKPTFRYKKCDIIPEYIRYASTHNKYHLKYETMFLPPPLTNLGH